MRSRRLLVLLALALSIGLVAGACGDDDDTTAGDGTTTTAGVELDLLSAGKLKICTDAPYAPFEFKDADTNEWTGFDIDLVRAMADNLGLEIAISVVPFDGIWLKPAAGDCDMVASAMSIKPDRVKNSIFTDPYFDADQSLLVRAADAGTINSLEATAGKTIGVQTGTTGEDYAEENAPDDAELKAFDEPAAMFLALDSGDVDAILQDLPVNADRATKDDKFVIAATLPTGEQYGFAVRNQGLADALNEQLQAVKDDGTYDTIFQQYFPTDNA